MASAKTRPSPMQDFAACVSHAEGVEATVDYLVPGSRINRRYVAPGAELNTGRYAPYTVFIRNGRPVQGTLSLDTQGFVLAKQPSLVANFRDKTEVDAVYSAEVERIVKALTGADPVALLGYVLPNLRNDEFRDSAPRKRSARRYVGRSSRSAGRGHL
jgi:hypothetical protein